MWYEVICLHFEIEKPSHYFLQVMLLDKIHEIHKILYINLFNFFLKLKNLLGILVCVYLYTCTGYTLCIVYIYIHYIQNQKHYMCWHPLCSWLFCGSFVLVLATTHSLIATSIGQWMTREWVNCSIAIGLRGAQLIAKPGLKTSWWQALNKAFPLPVNQQLPSPPVRRRLRLRGVSWRWPARRVWQLRKHQEALPRVSTSVPWMEIWGFPTKPQ